MRKRTCLLILLIVELLLNPVIVKNLAAADLIVKDISIATSVKEKVPEGISTKFSADVEKLYCYTLITGSSAEASIKHIWYFNGKVMASVVLPIKSTYYRTFSSKNILPNWKGDWKVEIVSAADGSVLASTAFQIGD